MTARMMKFAGATAKQAFIAPMASLPSMLPPNIGAGRFVWEITASGYGYPGLTSAAQSGLSVWDWNATTNRYELQNFATTTSWAANYAAGAGGALCMVNATQAIVVNNGTIESTADTKVGRALTTIGASPASSISFTTPATYAYDDPAAVINQISNPVGYASNLLYGLSVNGTASTWPTSNGYTEKVSASAASRNATALATGLTASNNQISMGRAIAGLGGAAPNGYIVEDISLQGTSCTYRMVNCTGTPVAVGTAVTYTGTPVSYIKALAAIGASAVVAFDAGATSSLGHATLLLANSATAPTTLTNSVQVNTPAPIDFAMSNVSISCAQTDSNAANCWFKEGAMLVWMWWERSSAAGGGDFYRPMIVNSTGAGNLTMSIPLTDMEGKQSPLLLASPGASAPIVSAPGGKAVVLLPIANGQIQQYVYQL